MASELELMMGDAVSALRKGDWRRVEDLCRELLLSNPGDPSAMHVHTWLGIALSSQGRHAEAVGYFGRVVLGGDPDPGAWINLGRAQRELGRLDEAVASFRKALGTAVNTAAVLNLAMALNLQGDFAGALSASESLLSLDPGNVDALMELGVALQGLGRLEEAEQRFRRAVALEPGSPETHSNLGNTLVEQGRLEEALACYRQGLLLRPDDAGILARVGVACFRQRKIAEAAGAYERSLAIRPGDAETHYNLGVARTFQDRLNEAIACYEKALELRPFHAEARSNLAVSLLTTGQLERGWEFDEWRFRQVGVGTIVPRRFPFPEWRGEPLRGRNILVWGERGVGDELLFASMYHEVASAARACVIECAPKLSSLFTRSFPGATIVARADPPHASTRGGFDFQVPAGDLCRRLRPTLASFPARPAYLVAPAARVAHWKERLAALGPGPRIGFTWRSRLMTGIRALDCTTLDQWAPVFAIPGVHFVCLQYDKCDDELAQARDRFGVALHAFPEVDLFNDLDEAAALTEAVDLVISAPTAASVLSAALGVPTWQMVCGVDGQMLGTDRKPWLPAVTMFKRAYEQEWEEILLKIAGQLQRYVADARP